MQAPVAILVGILSLIGALNVLASIRLYRSNFYDKRQKIIQVVLIWAMPLLGSIAILLFLNEEPWRSARAEDSIEHTDRYNLDGHATSWSDGHHD